MATTSPAALATRRKRLAERITSPALFVSGEPRPRNFPHNVYPYRAESHFLYFVGRPIPGAALVVSPDGDSTLYATPPGPDDELWHGPTPGLGDLEAELGIHVRPLNELAVASSAATLPAQDAGSAAWQSERVGRTVVAGWGDRLEGADAALADAVIALRLVHDAAAIAQLKDAARITVEAHRAGMRATPGAKTDAEVRAAMIAVMIAEGVAPSYNAIVTVRGETLHKPSSDGILGKDDLILADVGAESSECWAGDVTRVWPVSGRFSATQRDAYLAVMRAHESAVEHVRPGVSYRTVHHAAGRALTVALNELGILTGDPDELFEAGAHAIFFPHGVGHLLGLDVHDMEDLGDRAGYAPGRARSESPADRYLRLDRDLEPGMALTIEPGFYQVPALLRDRERLGDLARVINWSVLERFSDARGIRIEDDLLVTEGGHENLTDAIPKSISGVEQWVKGG